MKKIIANIVYWPMRGMGLGIIAAGIILVIIGLIKKIVEIWTGFLSKTENIEGLVGLVIVVACISFLYWIIKTIYLWAAKNRKG